MTFTKTETTRAIKPHRCTWCGQRIEKGERYFRWVSFGDSVFVNKMHAGCMTVFKLEAALEPNGVLDYTPLENERGEQNQLEHLASLPKEYVEGP